MQRLIIHIGIAKTGSSAIQSALASNVEPLRKLNMVYPASRNQAAASAGLISSGNGGVLAKALGVKTHIGDAAEEETVFASIEQVYEQGCDLLYSSEMLSLFGAEELRRFVIRASAIGFHVQIAAYVRSIADLLISGYHQQIKRHAFTGTLGEHIQNARIAGLRQIVRLHKLLPREQIILRNYDGYSQNLLEDFFSQVLGFESTREFNLEKRRVNRSLTDVEVRIMREMNRVFQDGKLGTMASNVLVYADQNASYRHSIGASDLQCLERRFAGLVDRVNRLGVTPPIGIRSADVQSSEVEPTALSEAEQVFARLIAGMMLNNRPRDKPGPS